MRSSIRLGRLFGIEVGLHYSWFLIALLITMSLTAQFHQNHTDWSEGIVWATSVLTALLFFAALLAHEMSHALVARSHGLKTREITLLAWPRSKRSRRIPRLNSGSESSDPFPAR